MFYFILFYYMPVCLSVSLSVYIHWDGVVWACFMSTKCREKDVSPPCWYRGKSREGTRRRRRRRRRRWWWWWYGDEGIAFPFSLYYIHVVCISCF
ncbi:hypothetical protein MOQ_010287, partial [Trypanosoma cruzi marinkellei]